MKGLNALIGKIAVILIFLPECSIQALGQALAVINRT